MKKYTADFVKNKLYTMVKFVVPFEKNLNEELRQLALSHYNTEAPVINFVQEELIKIDSVICEYVAERDGTSWLIFDVLLESCRDNPFEALLREEALNTMQEIAYEQGGYSIEVVPMYCQPYDRTFLMKEIRNDKGEPITEEVVGWYYGKPNNNDTKMFIGDLKAIHQEIEYETD